MILTNAKGEAMTSSDEYYELIGREIVSTGRLRQLREQLNISRSFMSELLQSSPATYRSWEQRPEMAALMWPSTAGRIGRFYAHAVEILDDLETQGIDLAALMPFHRYAEMRGKPLEQLLVEYRNGDIRGVDLSILGLWIYHDQSVGVAA